MSVATMPLVGKKFQAKLGGMANEAVASGVSSFAKRQMEKMGWTEGKGLGKEEQGMATHIKVKRREENMGVGVETKEKEDQTNQWWYNVYNNVANKIVVDPSSDDDDDDEARKAKKAKKKAKKELKRKREASEGNAIDEPTDEQLFAATGGKLFGRRAYGSCKGKLMRDAIQTGKVVTDTVGDSKKRAKKSSKKAKKVKRSTDSDASGDEAE